jgi:arylsulfatase A-like enzyme
MPLKEGTYIHDLIMEDAFSFIEKSVKQKKPFFCYIPTAVPHAAMHAPKELHEKWRKVYPEFDQRIGKYGAGPGEPCPNVVNPIAGYAAMMENFDNQVGHLLNILKELEVDDNTLVLFASDNGTHSEGGHNPNFWDSNGPLRGIKRDLYEGGINSPFLARWPGKIKKGSTSDHISAFWDVMATMVDLTGQSTPKQSDGISFLPELLGKTQKKHEYLYFEHPQTKDHDKAVRMGKWKGILRGWKKWKNRTGKIELYDLSNDPSEQKNLAGKHPKIVAKIQSCMNEAHTPLKK